MCAHKPCKQKTSGKHRRFCNTCFKQGLQKGSLPLKDGSVHNFKKAQRVRAVTPSKKNGQSEMFSEGQMQVLKKMAVQANSSESLLECFDTAPPGPLTAKRKHVMERLGESASNKQAKSVSDTLVALDLE